MGWGRSALKRGLALVGLAPLGQVEGLSGHIARAESQIGELKRQVEEARGEVQRLKGRAEQTAKELAAAQREHERATADAREWRTRAEASRAEAEQWKGKAEEWKSKADQYAGQLREMKGRLERAEHASRLAHEHLMATEVKLDLIEAAITALDGRTRAAMPGGPPPGADEEDARVAATPSPSADAEKS